MAEVDDEGFGDFIFAPRSSFHAGVQIGSNGFFVAPQPSRLSGDVDDDDWGDFVAPLSHSQSTPDPVSFGFDFPVSGGFSPDFPPPRVNSGFDAFGVSDSSSDRPAESRSVVVGSDSVSKKVGFDKPRGPLPLSFFGEEEDGEQGGETCGSVGNLAASDSNVVWNQKQSETVANEAYSKSKLTSVDVLSDVWGINQQIKSENGTTGLDTDVPGSTCKAGPVVSGVEDEIDDEGDWEFHGALSENRKGVTNFEDKASFELSGFNGWSVGVTNQDRGAGQDTSEFPENGLGSKNASHDFADLFTGSSGSSDKNDEVNAQSDLKATAFFPNEFVAFPIASSTEVGTENGLHDTTPESMNGGSDDFGDFIVAASNPESQHLDDKSAADDADMYDGLIADNCRRPESHRQPLPTSLFSDGVVESGDNDIGFSIGGPAFTSKNGIISQNSTKSIHDMISDLYNQSEHVISVDSCTKPAENRRYPTQKWIGSSPISVETFSNNSWDFKDGAGVEDDSSAPQTSDVALKSSVALPDLQNQVDFYSRLRGKLCFHVSHLLDDAEETQISGDSNGEDGKPVTSNNKMQEAREVLRDNMEELQLENNSPIDGSLNEFLQVLHEQKFQMVESEHLLSERLPLAEKDWFAAVELLKEIRLLEKVLTSASGNDQSAFLSTWSSILNACAEELRHGALIWKRAIENNLQMSILSDRRGQQYLQALGEIYRVVQLLRISNQVYTPWVLLRKEDQSSFSLIFDECSALWSKSGVEEAFLNLLGVSDSGSVNAVEALLESITRIQEIDVFPVRDSVFHQQGSICQLTLLPEEMLPELKMVSWNEKRCFLNVANLWANLISHEPPSLPHFHIG